MFRTGFVAIVLRLFLGVVFGIMARTEWSWAADWPQFRGPNRDGRWEEIGILKSFPKDGLKIEWRHPVGGGWPSPVVASGRVFVFDVELIKPMAR